MKNTLLTLVLLLSGFYASAQNYLFEKGQSGFHIGGQLGFGDGSTLLGLTPGYTWDGRLSLSLSGGRERNNEFDLTSYSLKPYLSYMLVKQDNQNVPVSVSLGGSYQYNMFPDFDEIKSHTIGFDLGLFRRFYLGEKVSLIPGAFIGWGETKLKSTYGFEEKNSAVLGAIQMSLLVDQFHLTPSVNFSKDVSSFNLQIGFIFPDNKNKRM